MKKTRFKLLLSLFIFLAAIILLFAVLSQPLQILTGVLDDAYPTGEDYDTGRESSTALQTFLNLALGAAVVFGVIFLIFMYGFKNLGGGDKNSFG